MITNETIVVIRHLKEAESVFTRASTSFIYVRALFPDGRQVVALERAAVGHGDGELRDNGIVEDADEQRHCPAAVGEAEGVDLPSSESGMLHTISSLHDLGQVGSCDNL